MVGERIRQSLITAKLGEGGMGVVWKALDERLGRPVALKFLTRAGDATHAARFAVEARAASALNHPGILTVHDIIEHNGSACLVMEFVEGRKLAEVITRTGMARGMSPGSGVRSPMHSGQRTGAESFIAT